MSILKKGDRVRHIEHGEAVVLKVAKDGTVWVKMVSDGIEGTVSIQALRRA